MLLLTLLLATAPELPSLPWTERSDWVNVQTDVTPAAQGDGQADDTAAIQAALSAAKDGSVVFLPPGTYRVTATLTLTGPLTGTSLIGCGRDTRIVWDGPEGGRMFHSNGVAYGRYVGLVWDGRGKAAVGFHHGAYNRFETEGRHEYEAFVDCREYGLKLGGEFRVASAEVLYLNCLFERCGVGVGLLGFNYYDNTFDRCEFVDCGQAIHDTHGNFYARNCHFERSREVDLHVASEHSSTVRWCTSRGAKQFLRQVGSVIPVTIQDCQIGGWTDPAGAIVLGGPTATIFDVAFIDPPSDAPPIVNRGDRPLVLSNVSAPGCRDIIAKRHDRVTNVAGGIEPSVTVWPGQSFFRETAPMPGRIFDAKADFGARGDHQTDDTDAVQQAIDAAREAGHGALAYLPTGKYVISRTIQITGADYTVGGTGFRCSLVWRGPADQPIVAVTDPRNVRLEQVAIGNHDSGKMTASADILQTSTGGPSRVEYDGVFVFGMYQKQPDVRGLRLVGLGRECIVDVGHLQGNVTITDSAGATILLRTSYEGTITVEGRGTARDGFLGVQTRLTTKSTEPLRLRDSQSLVASDWYVEQADRHVTLSGGPEDPPGRLTFSGAKAHIETDHPVFTVNGYHGAFVFQGDQFYTGPETVRMVHQGEAAFDWILWGVCFYNTQVKVQAGPGFRAFGVANQPAGKGAVPDWPAPAGEALVAAMDDWRRLGMVALTLDRR